MNVLYEVLTGYWGKHLQQVAKPDSPGYAPAASGRTPFFDFAGIRNLGAVCYMNSMNQQFFNVPSFRYCLLAAQDG